MNGCFITFEGIEGAGKSTQAKRLAEYLKKENKKVKLTREPGGTKLGQEIRKILLTPTDENFPPIAELFLYEADRNIHIHNVIKPFKEKGYYVISDRFIDSTLAYQGYARGLDINLIKELNRLAIQNVIPNITFLIDIPVEEGLNRIKRTRDMDRIEQEDIDFHKRLRDGFLKIAKDNPERIVVIDGMQNPDKIFEQILTVLKNKKII